MKSVNVYLPLMVRRSNSQNIHILVSDEKVQANVEEVRFLETALWSGVWQCTKKNNNFAIKKKKKQKGEEIPNIHIYQR